MENEKVLAKFFLAECRQFRGVDWQGQGRVEGPSCSVKLAAVKGEPFGSATPNGNIEMYILNPEAVAFFVAAWQAYCGDPDQGAKPPEFFVTFSQAEP